MSGQIQLASTDPSGAGEFLGGVGDAAKVVVVGGAAGGAAIPVSLTTQIAGERPFIDAMATVNAANGYMKVAAGSTNTVLVGAGAGALGDTLNRLIITVTDELTSTVSITDGSGTGKALGAYLIFPANMEQGTYSLQLGDMVSIDGAWKITTGAGASVIALGLFS